MYNTLRVQSIGNGKLFLLLNQFVNQKHQICYNFILIDHLMTNYSFYFWPSKRVIKESLLFLTLERLQSAISTIYIIYYTI